jgi:hypothetical protein
MNDTYKGRNMDLSTTSFSDFSNGSSLKEQPFAGFRPHHFKTLYEMAIRHDVAKMPVNFDEDDIEFLQQFPHAFWVKAHQQRYNLLFDALEKLHHERRQMGHDALKDAIIKAMTTQNWTPLKRLMTDDLVAHMARHLRPSLVKEMSPRQIDVEADKLAHEFIKTKTDRVEDPGEAEFVFQANDFDPEGDPHGKDTSSQRTRKTVTYVARPFLNRLYHKLERTRGLPHTPDSGLEGVGKFGYDLAEPIRSPNPEELPHATSGMKFPSSDQMQNRIREYMNLNQHRMFGEFPKNAVWLPTKYADRWSIGYVQDKIRKALEARLRISGQYQDNKDLERDARAMAKKQIIELAKAGKLKGPPIPGRFPNGIPIEVEGLEGHERLIPPPLYLPHEAMPVKIKQPDGGVKIVKRQIPLVNPAHFFRELGSDQDDHETETGPSGEERRKYGPDGQPIFRVPADKLRGHEKQFVHVGDDEFVPTKHRGAALDFNHNTEGRQHLTRGDVGYDEAFEKVFGSQRKVVLGTRNRLVPTTGPGFYEDVMRGILMCYSSQACGGGTGHERAILTQNTEDLHQIIVQKMLMDLRNHRLYDPVGRVQYAKNKTSNYIQKDLGQGGGTRRLRKLTQTARTASLDATTTGKDGGQVGIADKLMSQAKAGLPAGIPDKRGMGGRRLDTSGHNNAYSLDNFRATLRQLSGLARDADVTSARAKEMSHGQTGQQIIDMLQGGIADRAAVIEKVSDLLSALYAQSSNAEPEARILATKQVQSWVEDGNNTSEKLVAAFGRHPLVQGAVQGQVNQVNPVPQNPQPIPMASPPALPKQGDTQGRMKEILARRKMGGTLPKAEPGLPLVQPVASIPTGSRTELSGQKKYAEMTHHLKSCCA